MSVKPYEFVDKNGETIRLAALPLNSSAAKMSKSAKPKAVAAKPLKWDLRICVDYSYKENFHNFEIYQNVDTQFLVDNHEVFKALFKKIASVMEKVDTKYIIIDSVDRRLTNYKVCEYDHGFRIIGETSGLNGADEVSFWELTRDVVEGRGQITQEFGQAPGDLKELLEFASNLVK